MSPPNNDNTPDGDTSSRSRPPPLLQRLARGIPTMLAVGIGIGALGSIAAIGFTHAVNYLNDSLFISLRSRADIVDPARLAALTLAVPAMGGLVVGLIISRIPGRRAHAPPDAIEAAHHVDSRMPLRAGLLTAVAAVIGLGSGASVGQYGPIVHMGATLGSVVARLRRDLGVIGIGCGVAAGISTAFSAPIAGILFAHEVVLRHYSWRAFAPVTIASAVGVVVGNFLFHQPVLLPVGYIEDLKAVEYLVFAFIGIAGALVAVAFMRSVLAATALAGRTRLPLPVRTTLAGAFTGALAIWLPDILSTGTLTLRLSIMDLYNPFE
ncbi:MAG: chloride channel protein, partial [Phycisphaeraceae bacterium]